MSRKPVEIAVSRDRPLRILDAILLALCLCILALRVTYTEAPTAQMTSTQPANLVDTLYSLSVSSVLIFAFLLWVVVRIGRGRLAYHVTGIEFGLVPFMAAAAIAAVGASDKRVAITQTAMLLGPIFAALLLAQILNTDVRIRIVLAVIVALGVVSAYQCAEQRLVSNRDTIKQYEEHPETFLDPLGIEPGTFQHFLFEHRLYSQGIRGYFTTSNSAASFSIMAAFAAVVLLFRKRPDQKNQPGALPPILLPALAAIAALAGLLLTKSKGGILAFAAASVLFGTLLALRKPLGEHRRLALAILVPLVLLSAGLAGCAVVKYGLSHGTLPGGNSMLVRWQYWTSAARMYADHPWTGVGLGNFPDYYPHYKPDSALESVSDPHNVLLSLATQCGPLGLLGFLAMIFVPLWRTAARAGVLSVESESPPLPFRRPALLTLAAISAALMIFRPLLIPGATEGGVGVFVYVAVTLYVAPAAAFLVGFVLIAAPLESASLPSSRLGRAAFPAAMASAALAVLLHNLVDFAIFEPGVWMTLWVVIACLVANDSEPHPQSPMIGAASPARRAGVIAIAVLLMAVYCIWVWRPVWSTTVKIQDAMAAISTGEFDRAHEALEAASTADPLSATAANTNGRLYLQQCEAAKSKRSDLLDKAIQCLRRAIDANPADYKSYEKLAQAYAQGQRWQDAYDWYLKAVARYPGSERLWFRLGQTAEQLGQPDAALGHYERAVRVEEAYQQQFHRMYPDREKVISRLGEKDLATARRRIEELSNKTRHE